MGRNWCIGTHQRFSDKCVVRHIDTKTVVGCGAELGLCRLIVHSRNLTTQARERELLTKRYGECMEIKHPTNRSDRLQNALSRRMQLQRFGV